MASVMTNGHLGWFAGPDSAFTEEQWVNGPSLAALQTLNNYSPGVKVDGTDFNIEASEQVDDRSFADQAGAQSRGPHAASGSIEIYTPGRGDYTSIEARAYDALTVTRTKLAIAMRPVKPQATPLQPGDEINLFRVITDDRQHNRNDASRTVGVGLVLQDNVLVNYIVPASVPTAPTVSPAGPITLDLDEFEFLRVTYQGRNVTVGAEYTSSDESVFRVTEHGIIVPVGAGTATFTVSVPGSATSTAISVIVNP